MQLRRKLNATDVIETNPRVKNAQLWTAVSDSLEYSVTENRKCSQRESTVTILVCFLLVVMTNLTGQILNQCMFPWKLPTYPFPNITFCPKCKVRTKG